MTPQEFKEIRLDLGLTQSGLAEILGRNVTTVSRYERGLLWVTAKTMLAMYYLRRIKKSGEWEDLMADHKREIAKRKLDAPPETK